MSDDVKDRVLEIVSIAKECPDNLQPLCFELLLRDYLENRQRPPAAPTPPPQPSDDQAPPVEAATGQQDLKATDLHMKARKFMERHTVSLDQINQLFYKENGEIRPLYDDLKTTRMAEGQIRIALLHALTEGLRTGEFSADGEAVRTESQVRKTYDQANFTSNFKKNATLFEGFESYAKGTALRLSEDGRKELAELVKELAR